MCDVDDDPEALRPVNPPPAAVPATSPEPSDLTRDATAYREPVSGRTVFKWSIIASLGVLLVGLATVAAYNVQDLLVQVAVAAFIAVSLDPIVRWMVKLRVRRSLAVTMPRATAWRWSSSAWSVATRSIGRMSRMSGALWSS